MLVLSMLFWFLLKNYFCVYFLTSCNLGDGPRAYVSPFDERWGGIINLCVNNVAFFFTQKKSARPFCGWLMVLWRTSHTYSFWLFINKPFAAFLSCRRTFHTGWRFHFSPLWKSLWVLDYPDEICVGQLVCEWDLCMRNMNDPDCCGEIKI